VIAPRASLAWALSVALTGCAGTGARAAPATAERAPTAAFLGPAVVVGTVVDGATGRPVQGASVAGPGGRETVSDARGRFELDLAVGLEGPLVARAGKLVGENRLRPLEAGRLEVVILLR
jgi:hypothetical protein